MAARLGPRAAALALALGCLAAPGAAGAAETDAADTTACRESIPDIYDRVSPTVVLINATAINPYQISDRVTRVVGSGVIIDRAGLILTNAHVAWGRQVITVTLDDGTSLPATLAGADPIFDLAVLRIATPSDGELPVAKLGDSSQVRVGEEVLAIGNPLGLEQTLTRGVVSAINRILAETPFSLTEPLIQTDTAINPGNSGGPLVDRCGAVIGITTAVVSDAQSIGFAIPVDLVKTVLPLLLKDGRVIRPWLGFHGQIVSSFLRSVVRMPVAEGLLVEAIEAGSPAEKAGIRGGTLELSVSGRSVLLGGDIVTEINGTAITSEDALSRAMRALKVGDTVKVTTVRDGQTRAVEYVLPERPVQPGDLPSHRSVAPLRGRR